MALLVASANADLAGPVSILIPGIRARRTTLALYQGTTLVVPQRLHNDEGLSPEYLPLADPPNSGLTYPYTGKEDDPANEKF
ncbi:MAG: hypothetical protein WA476_15070 [Acidobacteriaceae bacterium]